MELINFIKDLNRIVLILFIISLALFSYRLIYIFFAFKKQKPLKKTNKRAKFAILIPARDESVVIEKLLKSIKNQTYDKNLIEVYVITESETDITNKITEGYGYNYFVRKDLENKRTKGFALNEILQEIYAKNLYYDAFFVFDADNILAPNFIDEMNKLFWSGVEVGMAYRNNLNLHENWVATCSGFLFSNINTFQNKARQKLFKTMLINGTGYYISSKIIYKLKGFPFTSLTEDFEISTYLALNKIKTKYITTTEFFDEQPTSLKTLSKQRVRWIKGYLNVNKKYAKQTFKTLFSKESNKLGILELKLSLIPNAVFIITMLSYVLILTGTLIWAVFLKNFTAIKYSLFCILLMLLFYQIFIDIYTILQILAERKKFKLTKKEVFKVLILNPFFVSLFVVHAIKAIFSKNITWTKIEHKSKEEDNLQEYILSKREENLIKENLISQEIKNE